MDDVDIDFLVQFVAITSLLFSSYYFLRTIFVMFVNLSTDKLDWFNLWLTLTMSGLVWLFVFFVVLPNYIKGF